MKILVCFTLLLFSNCFAHEVKILAPLFPIGLFEAVSANIKGSMKLGKKTKFYSEQLSVAPNTFKTGIELRDEHFHKLFRNLKIRKFIFKDVRMKENKGHGILIIGKKKKKLEFTLLEEKPEYLLGELKINLKDFEINPPSFMGVRVKDEVTVHVKVVKSYLERNLDLK